MQTPPQIVFLGFEPAPSLRELVDTQLAKLERYFPRIIGARVTVEMPHQSHKKGNLLHVSLTVEVPGDDLVVSNDPGRNERHEDPAAAIRDAFDAMQRQLRDYSSQLEGQVKHHEAAPAARVIALGSDHGFLSTIDGRQLYFHENAVLDGQFSALAVGAAVSFVEEDGIEGPQASTVRVL